MSEAVYNTANVSDLFGYQKGFIEDINDPKGSGRVRVRIINKEFRTGTNGEYVPVPETQYLPWATVLMPVNASGGAATSASSHNLKRGDLVWVFFIEGDSKQRVVIGTQGAVANASSKPPETEYGPLQRYISQDPDSGDQPSPTSHVTNDQKEKNKNLGARVHGAVGDDNSTRQTAALTQPFSPGNPAGSFEVTVADGKCATNPATKTEIILAELFATLQHTNGNIGSYYISKYTGDLFELQSIAKGYITRVQAVISAAITRSFGELMALLKKGIQALIKALLAPLPGVLKPVVDWFTQMLERLGCTMEDMIDRIANFVESTLMGYLGNIVNWAACQTKRFIDSIFGRILSEMTGIIDTVFGGLSSVLGAIGGAVDIVGGAISAIMDLLGISCSGNAKCQEKPTKKSSKSGAFEGLKAGYNDLDELLGALESGNHLPIDSYCADALTEPEPTTEVNVWGPQVPDSGSGTDTESNNNTLDPLANTSGVGSGVAGPTGVNYDDILNSICSARTIKAVDIPETDAVTEGSIATVKIQRTGDISTTSSVTYYTVDGTAKANEDYCPTSGFMGFGVGETERSIDIQTINDGVDDGAKYFFVKIKHDGCGKLKKDVAKVWIGTGIGTPSITGINLGTTLTPGASAPIDVDVPVYILTADKSVVYEGQEVTFTLNTFNVDDGTQVNYTIGRESTGITFKDINYVVENGSRSWVTMESDMGRKFVVKDGQASVTIALLDDGVVENTNEVAEQLYVELNGLSVAAGVAVLDPLAGGVLDETTKSVSVVADKVAVEEGESVTFTVTTTKFNDGDKLAYTIFGPNITQGDILQNLEGELYIENNSATFTVDVLEDNLLEVQENLVFSINEYGANATVIIRASAGDVGDIAAPADDDDDDGLPVLDVPIVDEDGGIIDIDVIKSGRRFLSIPFISLESNTGFGAYVEPILNSNGYLSRVRVIRPGQGYTGKTKPNNVVCQLVGITLTNVGGLYTSAPKVYIDGDSSIARATISEEGYVNGINIVKGGMNYVELPQIIITGGGGFGAQAKPDLQCVPEDQSELILQGLARDPANYVDCP